ncbi:MAG: hypothetical protein WA964_20245, partial [Ilumatobacter sp.]|uniref:hypothetical protein n=1 Tax=Ilumatobacter sp. TaxID=1967498 RepID=UPI003C753048
VASARPELVEEFDDRDVAFDALGQAGWCQPRRVGPEAGIGDSTPLLTCSVVAVRGNCVSSSGQRSGVSSRVEITVVSISSGSIAVQI